MATKSISWGDGSGDYIRLTYTGEGSEVMKVESDTNNLAVARRKVITLTTTKGGVVTKNLTVNQEACSFPIGDIRNFAYTGIKQTILLPAGRYKLQCWGAQGGSNGTNSTYSIVAKAGGKGGYSEGIITLTQPTEIEVNVGGQGTSSAGGYNGGGSTVGTSQFESGDEFGYSKIGGGGGATDIRLSDGALLSRMIVAGGGSGGAMCYKKVTTPITVYTEKGTLTCSLGLSSNISNTNYDQSDSGTLLVTNWYIPYTTYNSAGKTLRISLSNYRSRNTQFIRVGIHASNSYSWISYQDFNSSTFEYTVPVNSSAGRLHICVRNYKNSGSKTYYSGTISVEEKVTSSSYTPIGILNCNLISSDIESERDYDASSGTIYATNWYIQYTTYNSAGKTVRIRIPNYSTAKTYKVRVGICTTSTSSWLSYTDFSSDEFEYTVPVNSSAGRFHICLWNEPSDGFYSGQVILEEKGTSTSVSESNEYQIGYVGGGTSGGGYSNTYKGKQNAAGSNGSFGQGANQITTNYRYCSGAGGGGWYGGGGGQYSNSSITCCKYSGGGSGFVNIAANSSYRPSGYTGLQLDSGTTKDGATSFEAPGGGNETGHEGNGYARITRLS